MGPPIYIGGNEAQGRRVYPAIAGFNGATDLYRWKHELTALLKSAEPRASMGPPIYIGGNEAQGRRVYPANAGFNGATDLYRWKPTYEGDLVAGGIGFNGATDLYRWKPYHRGRCGR